MLIRSSFFQLSKMLLMVSAWVSVSLSVNAGQKAHVGLWRGRVPLTSEARLIHLRSFVDSALPVAPSPPAHHSMLHVRRIATLGTPGPRLWRVVYGASSFALYLYFQDKYRCERGQTHGCRCLSLPMRDKRRTWASLPRSPSPRHLYSISRRGRVPLTSEARLIHLRSFVDSALPVAPSPPAHRSMLHVRRIATLGTPGPRLWRVVYGSSSFALWLIIYS